MDWGMIGTIFSGITLMSGGIGWAIHRLNNRFVELENSMGKLENSMKDRFALMHSDFQQQSKRTDRLYEMFIDLLKEKK